MKTYNFMQLAYSAKRTWELMVLVLLFIIASNKSFGQDEKDRNVMIFYSSWANGTNEGIDPATNDVWVQSVNVGNGPAFHYWGKPWWVSQNGRNGKIKDNYVMYKGTPATPNNELLDWHADLLVQAGVDIIAIDLTNGTQAKIIDGAEAICRRYAQRFNEGKATPKIVMWVKDQATLQVVQDRMFNAFDGKIFFNYLGKKLVCVASSGAGGAAIPTEGIFKNYTCRRMWGLQSDASSWQFKVNNQTPPAAYQYNGKPEQMCAAVATQASYMIENGKVLTSAQGRKNGDYFKKYMDAAIASGPKFLMITSWNEWASQNQNTASSPTFVDIWLKEYSADIEPHEGPGGWDYYDIMKTKIAEYKQTNCTATAVQWDMNSIQDFGNDPSPSVANIAATGGILSYNVNGTDPFVLSKDNLNICASNNPRITIRIKNGTALGNLRMYFTTTSDAVYSEEKSVAIDISTNDANFKVYTLNMSSNANWKGTIKRLRLDAPNGSANGKVEIDYISTNNNTLGIDDVTLNEEIFKIHPNPSIDGIFNLSAPQSWEVHDLLGKKVKEGNGNEINLSEAANGIYVVKVSNSSKGFKVVKE
jgi:hypothetical protein